MRILAEQTVALAIDYQEKLIPAILESATLLRASKILLAGLEALNVPVLVSRQYPKGLGDTVKDIREVTSTAQVLDKTSFSCYGDEAIRAALEKSGRKNVLLCGTEAHVCVLQTAVDLLAAGYHVVYVANCTGSRKRSDKRLGIERVRQEGATVVTYEQILFELTGGATHPAFKTISNLVK